MRSALIALLGLALATDAGRAAGADRAKPLRDVRAALDPAGLAAFERLFAATRFESAEVSEDAHLSDKAAAVRTLIRRPAALAAFQVLYDHGSTVGRLYALTAFWYLRPRDFPALVDAVRVQ